jgi:glyoxylase-like metal-dependent hydrolase (beta-lactamase superfamily II)
MGKWLATIVFASVIAGLVWWWAFDGSTPEASDYDFRISELRAAAATPAADRPRGVAVEVVATGTAPQFAAIGGFDFKDRRFDYAAFGITYADGRRILVDTAVDEDIAKTVLEAEFDKAAYQRLIAAMRAADRILVTHEHVDHLPVVARHPEPDAIAPKLLLTAPEVAALPAFAPAGRLARSLIDLPATDFSKPTRVAPGVAAMATPGHTKGHVVVYVQRNDGTEYLLVGDIAWLMDSVTNARTRPRFLQTFFFDPPEQRRDVQLQVRALHNLARVEPKLVILPAHDADHIAALVKRGELAEGFQ